MYTQFSINFDSSFKLSSVYFRINIQNSNRVKDDDVIIKAWHIGSNFCQKTNYVSFPTYFQQTDIITKSYYYHYYYLII